MHSHWLSELLTAQLQKAALLSESKDALVLRLKYHKTTVFVPCRPSSTLLDVKQAFLSAAKQTKQAEPALHSSSDGKLFPGWSGLDATDDIGLFVAGSTSGDSSMVDGMTTFMPIDQDAGRDKATVSKAGLKDADVICVGFRAQGAGR